VLQSLFDAPGNHPVRIRLYAAAYEPLADASVHDVSVYATASASPATSIQGIGEIGIGAAGRWTGTGYLRLTCCTMPPEAIVCMVRRTGNVLNNHGLSTSSTAMAPAIEYNWSANAG